MQPVMTAQEIVRFLDREFPQIHAGGRAYSIESVSPGEGGHASDSNGFASAPGRNHFRSLHDVARRPLLPMSSSLPTLDLSLSQ